MGSGELQVVPDELGSMAGQWEALGARLGEAAPPSAGQPFQPTTAAVNGVNAAIGVAAAAFTTRTRATAADVSAARAGYTDREAAAAGEMAAVTPQRMV